MSQPDPVYAALWLAEMGRVSRELPYGERQEAKLRKERPPKAAAE